jgi:hypothetical protein
VAAEIEIIGADDCDQFELERQLYESYLAGSD